MPNADGRLDAIRGIGRSHTSVFQSCKDLDSEASAVLTTGNFSEDFMDAAMVSLSFVRAHAPWLAARYGLEIDPRQRTKHDFLFAIDNVCHLMSGISAGAAFAGGSEATICKYSAFESCDLWTLTANHA